MTHLYKKAQPWLPEFLILAILLIITRIADGLLTYTITPDLTREANPLVSIFGQGWATLILVATIVLIGVMWLNFLSLTRPIDNFPTERCVSYTKFKANYFNTKGTGLFAKYPGRVFIYVCGYIFPRAIIAWSLILLLHNSLVLTDVNWYRPIREYRLSYLIYMLLPILSFVYVDRLQKLDYKRYLNSKVK